MSYKAKTVVSFLLFALAVLSFTSGFVMLMLVIEVWYGSVAMFVFGVACIIAGIIIYPKGKMPIEEVNQSQEAKRVEPPHYTSSFVPTLEEQKDEEEGNEEERLRKREQELEDEWDEDEFFEELDEDDK